MVLGNVPKLHGLIGIGALTAAVVTPIGCSDESFSGCEASRTCDPSSGGASSTGGTSGLGGEGGNPDTGGAAGSTSGTSGTTGTDGGAAGAGGSGDDNERPTVEAFTPTHGSTDVERDIEVTAELSEPIDEATVTGESVTLEGPDGEVAGTLGVEGNVITFVPDKPLYLLGDYTFTIGDTVADLAGNTLSESASAEFQVRDGRWSEPTYPFGQTVPRVATRFERNELGDAVIGIEVWPEGEAIYGAVYEAAQDRWTTAEALPSPPAANFSPAAALAIDLGRRAAAAWYHDQTFEWCRFSEEDGWIRSGTLGGGANIGVSSAGSATAAWWSSAGVGTRTKNLVDGSLEPEASLALSGVRYGPYPVVSLNRTALLATRTSTGGEQLVVAWKTGSTWATPEPLALADSIGRFAFDSDELGNIIVVWSEGDEVWSRAYEPTNGAWTRRDLVGNAPDPLVGAADMTNGRAVVWFNSGAPDQSTWAAVYEAGVGWLQDSIVRLDPEWSGGGVGVSMDRAGNGLAAWRPDGGALKSRRYVAGSGWRSLPPLEKVINPYYIWGAGAPDGSMLLVSNALLGDEKQAPWTIRFE